MSRSMSDREAAEIMRRCAREITDLRATIAALQSKADAYDNLVIVLRLLPRSSQGMGVNLVWTLEQRIKELPPEPVTGEKEGN